MVKKLVVFYSFERNTKLVAESIAKAAGADLLELKPERELQTHGFMKYVWGGRQAFMKEKPELLPLEKNPGDYDVIFIGTPVWAWTMTPPVRSFLAQAKIKGKKIALFCCCENSAGKTIENLKRELEGNEIVGEMVFRKPLDDGKQAGKAREWAKSLAD